MGGLAELEPRRLRIADCGLRILFGQTHGRRRSRDCCRRSDRLVLAVVAMLVSASAALAAEAAPARPAAEKIQHAIDAAQRFLISRIDANGMSVGEADPNNSRYGGKTALLAGALLWARTDPANCEPLARSLDWLSQAKLTGTYAVALRACAMGMLDDANSLRLLARDARWLVLAANNQGAYTYTSCGGKPSKRWDNSNSQLALLGISAALERGVDIPAAYLRLVERHWLGNQQADGGWGYLTNPRTNTRPVVRLDDGGRAREPVRLPRLPPRRAVHPLRRARREPRRRQGARLARQELQRHRESRQGHRVVQLLAVLRRPRGPGQRTQIPRRTRLVRRRRRRPARTTELRRQLRLRRLRDRNRVLPDVPRPRPEPRAGQQAPIPRPMGPPPARRGQPDAMDVPQVRAPHELADRHARQPRRPVARGGGALHLRGRARGHQRRRQSPSSASSSSREERSSARPRATAATSPSTWASSTRRCSPTTR